MGLLMVPAAVASTSPRVRGEGEAGLHPIARTGR
jgi:hypothetical protein